MVNLVRIGFPGLSIIGFPGLNLMPGEGGGESAIEPEGVLDDDGNLVPGL